jgi:hypothetical protein
MDRMPRQKQFGNHRTEERGRNRREGKVKKKRNEQGGNGGK